MDALYQMMNIKNSTVAKLTSEEAQILGLANIGFGFYKGELKTRYNGMKRQSEDGVTFFYESEALRIEFTELVSDTEERHWAARLWQKDRECYSTLPMGIMGCDFFR